MSYIKKTNKDKESNFIYSTFFIFILILFSHESVLFGTNGTHFWVRFGQFFYFLTAFILVLLMIMSTNNKAKFYYIVGILLFVLFLNLLIDNGTNKSINNYLYKMAVIFTAGVIGLYANKDLFLNRYNKVIYWLCIFSLFTWALYNLFPGLFVKLPIITNYKNSKFYNLIFAVLPHDLSSGLYRNYSIFREPGVFIVFLNLALLKELFYSKDFNIKHIIVYIAGIVSTFSTAGVIVMAMLVGLKLLEGMRTSRKKGFIGIVAVVFTFIVLYVFTDIFVSNGILFGKFISGTNAYGSFLARFHSITRNIEIAFKYPFFGSGTYAMYDIFPFSIGVYDVVDNTNTFLMAFSVHGIVFGLIMAIGWWKFLRITNNLLYTIVLYVAVLLLYSNQDLTQNIIFYLPAFFGLFKNNYKNDTMIQ